MIITRNGGTEMKNRLLALITSGMILSSATVLPPAYAALTPTEDTTVGELPAWIPNDLEAAEEFSSTYGGTRVDDGLICVVFKEVNEKIPEGEPRGMLRYILDDDSDTVMCVKHEVYGTKDSEFNYEVLVYIPLNKCDFEVTLTDTVNLSPSDIYYPDGKITYTFTTTSNEGILNTVETDIYSWLPDCFTEYCHYVNSNGNVARHGNYLTFCLETTTGTGFDWYKSPDSDDTDVIDYVGESYRGEDRDTATDDNYKHRIAVYQAKKDGHAKIAYDYINNYGVVYRPEEVEKRLIADCQIIDDTQTILFPGDMKVSLADSATGELLTLDEDAMPSIWTNISYNTPEGKKSTGPIYEIGSNPTIIRNLSSFLNADEISFGLRDGGLPKGYRLPNYDAASGYYNGTITPDGYMTLTKYDNGSTEAVFRLSNAKDPSAGETKITFYDADTGELIDIQKDTIIRKELMKEPFPIETYTVSSNPAIVETKNFYEPDWRYTINTYTKAGSYSSPTFKVTSEKDNLTEVSCSLKFTPNGDANGDGSLTVADAALLQKWLLAGTGVKLDNWKAADYCRDNKLDIYDLCLMRQRLVKEGIAVVPPDTEATSYAYFNIIGSDPNMYSGPSTDYAVVETVSEHVLITEAGFNKGNGEWVYAEHDGKHGWIRVYINNEDDPNIEFTELAYISQDVTAYSY